MDEKAALLDRKYGRRSSLPLYQEKLQSASSAPSAPRRTSRFHSFFTTFIIAGITYFLVSTYLRKETAQPIHIRSNQTALVPLEAHVMSKCPDAKTCLKELVVPAMEQVVDMVDFRLSYIGSVDDNDTLRMYT